MSPESRRPIFSPKVIQETQESKLPGSFAILLVKQSSMASMDSLQRRAQSEPSLHLASFAANTCVVGVKGSLSKMLEGLPSVVTGDGAKVTLNRMFLKIGSAYSSLQLFPWVATTVFEQSNSNLSTPRSGQNWIVQELQVVPSIVSMHVSSAPSEYARQ